MLLKVKMHWYMSNLTTAVYQKTFAYQKPNIVACQKSISREQWTTRCFSPTESINGDAFLRNVFKDLFFFFPFF